MDWTKSKTILIVALLVTNLFLLTTYRFSGDRSSADAAQLESETIALLEEQNIFIKGELPERHSDMPVLTVTYSRLDETFLSEKLDAQVPLGPSYRNRESILMMVEDFLKSCGVWNGGVVLESYQHDGDRILVSYANVYEEFRIEESYILCTVVGGKVEALERVWLEPVAFGRTKRSTMSASAALLSLLSKKHAQGAVLVEGIELIYWLDQQDYTGENMISDTAFPTWKITYNDGQILRVPAYGE